MRRIDGHPFIEPPIESGPDKRDHKAKGATNDPSVADLLARPTGGTRGAHDPCFPF